MKIVKEWPPNIEEIRKHFDLEGKGEVYFCYGDMIFNPSGNKIDADFVAHEEVHARQQAEMGGPEAWWARYFIDPQWRVVQEVEAYGTQFRYLLRSNARLAYKELENFAISLSSSLYGNAISYGEARDAIRTFTTK